MSPSEFWRKPLSSRIQFTPAIWRRFMCGTWAIGLSLPGQIYILEEYSYSCSARTSCKFAHVGSLIVSQPWENSLWWQLSVFLWGCLACTIASCWIWVHVGFRFANPEWTCTSPELEPLQERREPCCCSKPSNFTFLQSYNEILNLERWVLHHYKLADAHSLWPSTFFGVAEQVLMLSTQVAQVSHWAIKHQQSILSNRLKRGAHFGSSLAEQIYRYNLRQRTDIWHTCV